MCQGFRNTHTIRPDQSSTGVPTIMSEFADDILHDILEGSYPGESSVSPAAWL